MENVFSVRFLISMSIVSIFIISTIFIKKALKNHISVKWQYRIWYLVIIMMLMPLIPNQITKLKSNLTPTSINVLSDLNYNYNSSNYNNNEWINDFALSVSRSVPKYIDNFFILVWILGISILFFMIILSNYKLYKIKKSAEVVDNKIIDIMEECKAITGIKAEILLKQSFEIKTPMICGLFKVSIILPMQITEKLTLNEIKYILLHEISHYKNKDIFMNYVICIFQALYWFNPFVWIAFKHMKSEREILCDTTVLSMLNKNCYKEYGMTIIHFIEGMSLTNFLNTASDMGGSKKQIKLRIEKIASFKSEPFKLKLKSMIIFTFIFIFAAVQAPFVSAMNIQNNKFNFNESNIIYEDLSSYFEDFDGSFVLFDSNSKQYHIYNKEKSIKRVPPNSTYKIYSGLIALENNVISRDNSNMEWNGESYSIQAWNKNQNIVTAIQNSVNWYFQNTDKKVGFENLKKYLTDISYGNCDFSGGEGQFWLESSLKISPVEQTKLLKDLYFYNMNFKKENIEVIKSAMKLSEKNGAALFGKTGTGLINNKSTNGWFIGYVELNDNVYFFAVNIEGEGSKAAEIALSILKDKNIY